VATQPGQLRRVVDAVAPLEPELVEPDWRTCLGGVMRMSRRRAVVVVFSDALYAQTDDRLAALLGTLARRHVVVFASIRDSELTELAAQPVHNPAGLYERGVATQVIEDRDAALAGIRRRRVRALAGDITHPGLGLDPEVARLAAGRLRFEIHHSHASLIARVVLAINGTTIGRTTGTTSAVLAAPGMTISRKSTVSVDVSGLEFINSSCLVAMVTWITAVQAMAHAAIAFAKATGSFTTRAAA